MKRQPRQDNLPVSRASSSYSRGIVSRNQSMPPILSMKDLETTSRQITDKLHSQNYKEFYKMLKRLLETIEHEQKVLEKLAKRHEQREREGKQIWSTTAQKHRLSAFLRSQEIVKILKQTITHCEDVLSKGRSVSATHRVLLGEISRKMEEKTALFKELNANLRSALEEQRDLLREKRNKKSPTKRSDSATPLTPQQQSRVRTFRKNVRFMQKATNQLSEAKEELKNASAMMDELRDELQTMQIKAAGWNYDRRVGNARYVFEMQSGVKETLDSKVVRLVLEERPGIDDNLEKTDTDT